MGLYSGAPISGRIFASGIWGTYFLEGLLYFILFYLFIYLFIYLFFLGGLIIGILRYTSVVARRAHHRFSTKGEIFSKYCNITKTQGGGGGVMINGMIFII